MIRRAKRRSIVLKVNFNLVPEDIMIPSYCPILDIPLKVSSGKWSDNSPSLDRLIPELGYVKGNIAVISYRANLIKSYGTSEEHRKIANWIDNQF